MADLLPLPRHGETFLDARGDERTMRVSLHQERGVVVLSIWTGLSCRASFRLPLDEAIRLAKVLDSVVVSADTDPAEDLAEAG